MRILRELDFKSFGISCKFSSLLLLHFHNSNRKLNKYTNNIEKEEEYMSKVSNYKFNQIFGYKGPN